ncbi:MAG: hypothetical protein L3J95_02110 [Thermoplasmata archaeon]|nr:hypothetical protein [Thermoplasmata archaeon]MCI4359206.1 hypothetical protein [Thermoplasmata archaeon]
MDVPLYAVGLAVFAVLYLALTAFLIWAILITLIVMFLFLTLRYGNVAENYPHSSADVAITSIFIGITWGIFVFVGPKGPIPFVGNGFSYSQNVAATASTTSAVIAVALILLIIFLVVFSLAADKMAESRKGGMGTSDEGGKPKKGVGA